MKNPAQAKKKSLVRIATRLFKREGFSRVSIEDIVKAGEISIATFYSYFSAKEEVVCIQRNNGLERCQAFYKELTEGESYAGLNALQKLDALIEHIMGLLNKTGSEFSRIFAQFRIKERNAQLEDKPYLPLFVELMDQGQEAGIIRIDYTAAELADITDKALMGAYLRWMLHRSDEPMDRVCKEVMALHLKMLGHDYAGVATGRDVGDAWETALYMLEPDPRSGIKQMEEDWLERFKSPLAN